MEKSFLEKRIKERAEIRYRKEIDNLHGFLFNDPIGKLLEFDNIPLAAPHSSTWLKDGQFLKEIKEIRITELIKEETDRVLNQLDCIQYLYRDNIE